MQKCDDEKLHLIGSIQGGSDAYIVVISSDLTTILAASANCPSGLTLEAFQPMLSTTVQKMADLQVRSFFRSDAMDDVSVCICSPDKYILEVEPARDTNLVHEIWSLGGVVELIHVAGVAISIAANACDVLFEVLGMYDRGMVYRFNDDCTGEVVYEIKKDSVSSSYLNMRFPASDIPYIARALFVRNSLRFIQNVDAPNIDIIGADICPDLTNCRLRAVSKYHLMYLRNMGVKASLCVAIVIDGELWGLFAFHSYERFGRPTLNQRIICDIVGRTVSRAVEASADMEASERTRRLAKLIVSIGPVTSLTSFLTRSSTDILSIAEADAMCVWIGGGVLSFGDKSLIPSEAFWKRYFGDGIFTTNSSSQDDMLGLCSQSQGFVRFDLGVYRFAFFRVARSRDVCWGGNPDAPKDPKNPLHPRKSFEAYMQTASSECRSWRKEDIVVIEWLRERFGDMIAKENLASLKGSLAQSNDECAKALIAAKENRDFFAAMSHELRTPFHGVMGCIQAIEENMVEAMDMTRSACKSGGSMLRVLDDILASAKTAHGVEYEKEACTLSSLVEDSTSTMLGFASANGIVIETNVERGTQLMSVDKKRIHHTLTNLISNAIKFTASGGTVTVDASVASSTKEIEESWGRDALDYTDSAYLQGDVRVSSVAEAISRISPGTTSSMWAKISVRDAGCGVNGTDDLKTIFQPYEQGNAGVQKTHQGTGLGLYICTSQVSQMGGLMSCSSTLGKGTVMRFCFPMKPMQKVHETSLVDKAKRFNDNDKPPAGAPSTTIVRVILLVDDSKLSLKLLTRTATRCAPKARIMTATNGFEAAQICEGLLRDGQELTLLVTDYHMPGMSGDQVASQTKMTFPGSKVIAYTADSSEEAQCTLKLAGADAVLTKPLASGAMETCVSELLLPL